MNMHDLRWRFPLGPLLSAARLTESQFTEFCGVSGTTLIGYRTRGMTYRVADRLALQLGYHPSEIWSDWWDAVAADQAVMRARAQARQRANRERNRAALVSA